MAGLDRRTVAGVATVTEVCQLFGVSRAAYYAALQRLRTRQPPRPRARRPSTVSQPQLLSAIHSVLEVQPSWGIRKVWATLRREGLRVSRHRVWALMKAHVDARLQHHRPPPWAARGRVVADRPNQRWATDFTTVWTRQEGLLTVALTVDCGCRSLLGLEVSADQRAPSLLAHLERALRQAFGAPGELSAQLELRTDHGRQYTGRECAALVSHWRLLHRLAPRARPTGNAVVERLIRTMKEEVLWTRDWEDAAEMRRALETWLRHYNTARPHQALGFRTPAEVRAQVLACLPSGRPSEPPSRGLNRLAPSGPIHGLQE